MTILAKDLVDSVEQTLQDETNTQWTALELLNYLNEGQLFIVGLKPNAYSTTASFVLVAGVKQSIPATGIELIDVHANLGTDGLTPGREIWSASLEELRRTDPVWRTKTAAAEVTDWMRIEGDRRNFYVRPPQPTGASAQNYIEATYSLIPANATISGVGGGVSDSNITLDDVYRETLRTYMLFRAHSKETESSNGAMADKYLDLCLKSLGAKAEVSKDGSN